MKIRIEGPSIRFRLSAAEVRVIGQGGRVQSDLNFSPPLSFLLQTGPLEVRFTSCQLAVSLPPEWLQDWENNEVVGFEFDHQIESSLEENTVQNTVQITVEKDYPCAHTKEGKALFGKPKRMN